MTRGILARSLAILKEADNKKALLAAATVLVLISLTGISLAGVSYPATLSMPNGLEEKNTTFSFDQSTQGSGYFKDYAYAKAGNVVFKNYAHGSGSINNEAVLTYQKLNRTTHNANSDYNDFDRNCIQFKEDNDLVYAPMRIIVGTGYYAAYPVDYASLIKERTELKNYRAGSSILHEVEYAHALDKELELTGKEQFNYTYDPVKEGNGFSQIKINEDVTDGKAHIGVLQANTDNAKWLGSSDLTSDKIAKKSAWYEPSIEIDQDYFGTYHIERNLTLNVPYYLKQSSDEWLPCCFGGFASLTGKEQGSLGIGKSAKGIFDCTCFKAPTEAQFPRVY
jgi:hypothetical protein